MQGETTTNNPNQQADDEVEAVSRRSPDLRCVQYGQPLDDELDALKRRMLGPALTGVLYDKLLLAGIDNLPADRTEAAKELSGAGHLWHAVFGHPPNESVIRAAKRLGLIDGEKSRALLKLLYKAERRSETLVATLTGMPEQVEQEIEDAAVGHRLVAVHGDTIRLAWWDGQPLDVDWDSQDKAWQFLWTLVKCALRRRHLSRDMLGQRATVGTAKDQRRRLMDALRDALGSDPLLEEINTLIRAGNEAGTYRLELKPAEIWARRYDGDTGFLAALEF